jgi:FAD/FMN-containing dehydrogenase
MCKKDLGEILSSCEYIDAQSMNCVTKNLTLKCPIGSHPFYMLIETSGSNGVHDSEKINKFLEDVMNDGVANDGTVAVDLRQVTVR